MQRLALLSRAPERGSGLEFEAGSNSAVGLCRHRCNVFIKLPHVGGTRCITVAVPFKVFNCDACPRDEAGDSQEDGGVTPQTCRVLDSEVRNETDAARRSLTSRRDAQHSTDSCHSLGSLLRMSRQSETCHPDPDFLHSLVREHFGIPSYQQRLLVDGRPLDSSSVLKNGFERNCNVTGPSPFQRDISHSLPLGSKKHSTLHCRHVQECQLAADKRIDRHRHSSCRPVESRLVSKCSNDLKACELQFLPNFLNVTVLFRLRGGKGGFGANLRAVKGRRKKTTNNLDACRDLSGRRMRHAQAVERVKEWLVRKRQEDELVKRLTDGAQQLNLSEKEPDPSVSLDKGYVKQIRSRAVRLTRTVREGVREDYQREENFKAAEERAKEAGVSTKGLMSCKSWFLHKSTLSDDATDSEEEIGQGEEPEARVSMPTTSRPPRFLNSVCTPLEERALVSDSLLGQTPVDQQLESSSSFVSTASSSGTCRPSPHDLRDAAVGDGKGKIPDETLPGSKGKSRRSVPSQLSVEEQSHIEEKARQLDVSTFSRVEELEQVDPEVLKAKLRSLGMKCGGRPSERATRLFLLKTQNLQDLPAHVLAKANRTAGD